MVVETCGHMFMISHSEEVFEIVLKSANKYTQLFGPISCSLKFINLKGNCYNQFYIAYNFKKDGQIFNVIPERIDVKDYKAGLLTLKERALSLNQEIKDIDITIPQESRNHARLEYLVNP